MRLLAAIGALAIVIAVVAALGAFGGYINLGANVPDPAPLAWVIEKTRMASVSRFAPKDMAIPTDDGSIQAGAKAYAARGCANCHGEPGGTWQKFSEGLSPAPPDLNEIAGHRTPQEIFYVVKNGIKATGMPSFGAVGADDKEVATIAAFVKKLPDVKEDDYKKWKGGGG